MLNIPIIMYHCVNDHPDAHPLGFLAFGTEEFRQHLRFFQRSGYSFITLAELLQRASAKKVGLERVVVLTFDDGFLDNFLIAFDIMREFGAVGTVFVNPSYADEGLVRSLSDVPSAWGYLNWEEIRGLEASGVFDFQSHTMSHEMVFKSDHVVDLYEPSKFDRYYWLAWMLFPETLKQWSGDVRRFANLIPLGYPVFEYGRAIAHQAFLPSKRFIELCCRRYRASEGRTDLEDINAEGSKGAFESEQEWHARAEWQIRESKALLEGRLEKKVIGICFPGGAYDERLCEMAAEAGYRLFMLSSRDQRGDNAVALERVGLERLIGLKRISFSNDYPRFLRGRRTAYWNAKLKVGTFMGSPALSAAMRVSRATRSALRFLLPRFAS